MKSFLHITGTQFLLRTVGGGVALFLLLLFSACAGPEVTFYGLDNQAGTELGAPIPADAVDVYVTRKPTGPYTELGILSYSTNSWSPNEAAIYQAFRQKAAAIGADGVILLPSSERLEYLGTARSLHYGRSETVRTTYRGVAIKAH